jgi:hypothetical protein
MEAFSIVAALATAVQAVALIVLHLLPTGYNPVRDAVSDYGVGPYRGWFWLQAVAGGVGCLALGIALAQLHPFTRDGQRQSARRADTNILHCPTRIRLRLSVLTFRLTLC